MLYVEEYRIDIELSGFDRAAFYLESWLVHFDVKVLQV